MVVWVGLSWAVAGEPHEASSPATVEEPVVVHHAHRALGVKLVELTAFEEEGATAWVGVGFIAERPVLQRAVVELSAQGLIGFPGVSVPVDLLLKRVWFVGDRTVLTAGAGPSLTFLRRDETNELFPGGLASLGVSQWLGEDESWGVLAEVDFGGSFEPVGFVPELEVAVGAVWAF